MLVICSQVAVWSKGQYQRGNAAGIPGPWLILWEAEGTWLKRQGQRTHYM